jgi:hypothetical protein
VKSTSSRQYLAVPRANLIAYLGGVPRLHHLDRGGQPVKSPSEGHQFLTDPAVRRYLRLTSQIDGFLTIPLCILPPIGKGIGYCAPLIGRWRIGVAAGHAMYDIGYTGLLNH